MPCGDWEKRDEETIRARNRKRAGNISDTPLGNEKCFFMELIYSSNIRKKQSGKQSESESESEKQKQNGNVFFHGLGL